MTHLIDILVVAAVSIVVYGLEGLAVSAGWISVGPEARGASAVVAGALAVLAVITARGGSITDLGFRRPKSWLLLPFQALAILVVFVVAQNLVPLAIGQIVTVPEWDMSRYDAIAGDLKAALVMALVLPFTASIPEEVIYRGFLLNRLSDIFGWDRAGTIAAVIVQSLVFSAIHFTWGIGGMLVTFIMGLIWAIAYLLCDRNLWVVILAHSGGHLLFVAILYAR